jgi:hypothetical protein
VTPKTPNFPPEQITATVVAAVGILGQVVPLDEAAKQGITQLATTSIVTLTVHGAAVRLGRQKWWKNFYVDTDNDPSTPPVLARKILYVAAAALFVAIGAVTALVVVLVT